MVGIPVIGILLIPFLVTLLILRFVNKLAWVEALGGTVLLLLIGGYVIYQQQRMIARYNTVEPSWHEALRIAVAPILPTLGAYLLLLVQRWRAGVRTIGARHLLWMAVISIAYDAWNLISWEVTAIVLTAALVAPAALQWAMRPVPSQPDEGTDIGPEREKVLNMVSANQITAAEAAELLNALAAMHHAQRPVKGTVIPGRRLYLGGAALVLFGFLTLPWLIVNPGKELTRLAENMNVQMSGNLPAGFAGRLPDMGNQVQNMQAGIQTGDIQVAGAQLGYGIGWLILLSAIAVGVFPLLGESLDATSRRIATICFLCVEGGLLLYVFANDYRYASIGLFVVLAGFVCQVFGILRSSSMKRSTATVSQLATA